MCALCKLQLVIVEHLGSVLSMDSFLKEWQGIWIGQIETGLMGRDLGGDLVGTKFTVTV